MEKLKAYKILFEADEKYGKEKWTKREQFESIVFANNYKIAIKKAEQKNFINITCNIKDDQKNYGLPVKYRNIDVISLEKVAEENL